VPAQNWLISYQSDYVIGDGTFEMASNTAHQLYTFHGFVNGEALPLAWALLPNKTQATYSELFTAIRSGLISRSVMETSIHSCSGV